MRYTRTSVRVLDRTFVVVAELSNRRLSNIANHELCHAPLNELKV
jgi:hypothetical protein